MRSIPACSETIRTGSVRDLPPCAASPACSSPSPGHVCTCKFATEVERGQATVIVVIVVAIVMLGFIAFALDVGYFFREKRMAQAAADAAAIAAAEEYGYGNSSNAQTVAEAVAKENGFDTTLATNPAVVTLTTLSSGDYSNSGSTTVPTSWIKAEVAQPIHGVFLSAFLQASTALTVSAYAYAAEGAGSATCVCLEGSSGQDLNMSNDSQLTASNCGITVDSGASNAIGIVGSSTLSALTLGTVSSNWDNSSNINNGGSISSGTRIVQGISSSCSPSLPTAPSDSVCAADPFGSVQGGAKYTVGPNSPYGTTQNGDTVCYTSLTVGSNGDTVTLNPGIYVINGGSLTFGSNGNKGGNGVFFYLENNAQVTIANGANVSLTAPSSGTYSNVLFYQEASDTKGLTLAGGSSAVINGNIYAPGAVLTINNGSGSSVDGEIVAQSLTMAGGGTLTSTPNVSLGTLNTSAARLTQ